MAVQASGVRLGSLLRGAALCHAEPCSRESQALSCQRSGASGRGVRRRLSTVEGADGGDAVVFGQHLDLVEQPAAPVLEAGAPPRARHVLAVAHLAARHRRAAPVARARHAERVARAVGAAAARPERREMVVALVSVAVAARAARAGGRDVDGAVEARGRVGVGGRSVSGGVVLDGAAAARERVVLLAAALLHALHGAAPLGAQRLDQRRRHLLSREQRRLRRVARRRRWPRARRARAGAGVGVGVGALSRGRLGILLLRAVTRQRRRSARGCEEGVHLFRRRLPSHRRLLLLALLELLKVLLHVRVRRPREGPLTSSASPFSASSLAATFASSAATTSLRHRTHERLGRWQAAR